MSWCPYIHRKYKYLSTSNVHGCLINFVTPTQLYFQFYIIYNWMLKFINIHWLIYALKNPLSNMIPPWSLTYTLFIFFIFAEFSKYLMMEIVDNILLITGVTLQTCVFFFYYIKNPLLNTYTNTKISLFPMYLFFKYSRSIKHRATTLKK